MIKITVKETQFEEIARQAHPGKTTAGDQGGVPSNGKKTVTPVDPELKQDAAQKVFQEGVTGKDRGADEAMAKLPHINAPHSRK
jgi:hypothetical protein